MKASAFLGLCNYQQSDDCDGMLTKLPKAGLWQCVSLIRVQCLACLPQKHCTNRTVVSASVFLQHPLAVVVEVKAYFYNPGDNFYSGAMLCLQSSQSPDGMVR